LERRESNFLIVRWIYEWLFDCADCEKIRLL